MDVNSIKKFGVVGAGQMGGGIAQVAAQTGFEVVLMDIKDEFLQRGLKVMDKNLTRNVEKGKITAEEKDAILARIKTTTALEDMADCDIVVEAATEKVDLKLDIFKKLDAIVKPEAILASNTSSISITLIANQTKGQTK